MITHPRRTPSTLAWKIALLLAGVAAGLALSASSAPAPVRAAEPAADASPFTRPTVDFGIVCRDVDKTVAFYTDVLGATEVKGFSVGAPLLTAVGLTDNQPGNVRVVKLAEGPGATSIKLMSFPEAPGKLADQSYIHSTYGLSYITLFVKSIDAALARAAEHDVKPLAKGPADLGGGTFLALVKDPDGNFVELVGQK
ncbi:MAG: hypothetical protein GC159_21790 [Phycisphaera sp.]|nr:hypothetical protein [Phycisphaera sp.]